MEQENICTSSIRSDDKKLAKKIFMTYLSNIIFSLPVECYHTSAINREAHSYELRNLLVTFRVSLQAAFYHGILF
jgi:hypothetical protein